MTRSIILADKRVDGASDVIVGSYTDNRGFKPAVSRITERPAPPKPIPNITGMPGYSAGIDVGRRAAAEMLDCSAQEIRLAAGEMTAQEMRTVKAVLAWRKAVILREAGAEE